MEKNDNQLKSEKMLKSMADFITEGQALGGDREDLEAEVREAGIDPKSYMRSLQAVVDKGIADHRKIIDDTSMARLHKAQEVLIEKEILLKNIEKDLSRKTQEISTCFSRIRTIQEAKFFLEAMAEEKEKEFIPKIQGIVQYSLDNIYGKGVYDFRIKMGTIGGRRSMDMGIVKNGEFIGIIDSNGGALVEIVSFILHICVVLISGVRRFVFSDEKFTFMDSSNSLRFCSFLSQLAEKLNMTIVLITHIQHIAESFPLRYRLTPSPDGVKAEKF